MMHSGAVAPDEGHFFEAMDDHPTTSRQHQKPPRHRLLATHDVRFDAGAQRPVRQFLGPALLKLKTSSPALPLK
jgi:hypothetical protein